MNNNQFTLSSVYFSNDEEGGTIIFHSYKDIMDYFEISNAELTKWIDEGETPWGDYCYICGAYLLERNVPQKKLQRKTEEVKAVLKFRTSYDGDHWSYHDELFTSMTKLVGFVEAFLQHQTPIPDEEVKALCERLLHEGYAKWVNPDDKKDKYYIHVQSEELDKLYLD